MRQYARRSTLGIAIMSVTAIFVKASFYSAWAWVGSPSWECGSKR